VLVVTGDEREERAIAVEPREEPVTDRPANALPLLVFVISLTLAMILFAIVIILMAGLLTLLGKLAGTWLVLLLVVPLYVAVMVALYATMFGTMYYLWRDVCGSDDNVPAVAQSITA
jgi:sterol desaturase/sphingolipid hydroxylase (fatty acid hydroxylase superfamily)